MNCAYQKLLPLAFLATVGFYAQAECNCATPAEQNQCTPAAIAKERESRAAELKAVGAAARAQPQLFDKKLELPLGVDGYKRIYQQARVDFGDKAVGTVLGRNLSGITPRTFEEPEFQAELALAARTLHPGGPAVFLKGADDRYKMTLPGTGAPVNFVLPDKKPVRYSRVGGCWTPLKDPFQVAVGGLQVEAAFGTNFPEVGRIVRVETDGPLKLTKTCGFVLLSPRWAVTALHCVADQPDEGDQWVIGAFKSSPTGPWRGERALFIGQSGKVEGLPGRCFGLATGECPWRFLDVERIEAPTLKTSESAPRMPAEDIALVRLRQPVTTGMEFPTFSSRAEAKGMATLVAYGTVAPPYYQFFDLQVGWNTAGSVDQSSGSFTWNPSKTTNQSSICPGDSGGAIFSGYENGGCSCSGGLEKPAPRRLTGIVSFVDLPLGSTERLPPALLAECRASGRAGAVFIGKYKDWICKTAPDVRACQGS